VNNIELLVVWKELFIWQAFDKKFALFIANIEAFQVKPDPIADRLYLNTKIQYYL
jgi:hypothetical protein